VEQLPASRCLQNGQRWYARRALDRSGHESQQSDPDRQVAAADCE
jgi:hypothetical protein